jgi:ferritin-like metal-binding protein YciE
MMPVKAGRIGLIMRRNSVMPEIGTLRDLIADRLEDLHGTEEEVENALPDDLLKSIEAGDLRERLMEMREKGRERRRRLAVLFALMKREPRGVSDEAAKAIRENIRGIAKMKLTGRVKDMAFIWALRRHLHLLIAGYATLRAQAKAAGLTEAADNLKESVAEVTQLDEILAKLAERAEVGAPA